MQFRRTCLGVLASFALSASLGLAAEPAFPGAQGWGRNATGGGQNPNTKILFVTSLDDDGPGTLREALMAQGPRIILFKTGGVIELKKSISFRNGDVTIAGQTAPGDGIILKNFPIRIGASNVVMRGIRIRNGDGDGPQGDLRDSLQIGRVVDKGVESERIGNVIVDHCSFGWSMDETVEFWYGAKDVTISNCVLSEALWLSGHNKGNHGYAMLIGNGKCERITVLGNLFAHNDRRNPWVQSNAQVEVINNVIYDWGSEAVGVWGAPDMKPIVSHVIGNYFKPGKDTSKRSTTQPVGFGKPPAPESKVYLQDNVTALRADEEIQAWDLAAVGKYDVSPYKLEAPTSDLVSGVKPVPAKQAYEQVLNGAGAVPRDAADARVVKQTREGSGAKIDRMTDIGGYPSYAPGEYPKDTDNDGMPDAWETARGLNPNDPADATKMSASKYLNIEDYLNSLIPTPAQ